MTKTTGEITEVRALRESYGITVTELCEELGMQNGLYSMHELGHRKYKEDRYETFYYKVANALENIKKRRIEDSYKVNSHVKITKNEFDEEQEEEELVYQPISNKLFDDAMSLYRVGKSIVWIAVNLEICELELERKIEKYLVANGEVLVGELAI